MPPSSSPAQLQEPAARKPFTAVKAPPAKATVASVARPSTSSMPPPNVPSNALPPVPKPVPSKRKGELENTAAKIARLTADSPVPKLPSDLKPQEHDGKRTGRSLEQDFDSVSDSQVPGRSPYSSLVFGAAEPVEPHKPAATWTPSLAPTPAPSIAPSEMVENPQETALTWACTVRNLIVSQSLFIL